MAGPATRTNRPRVVLTDHVWEDLDVERAILVGAAELVVHNTVDPALLSMAVGSSASGAEQNPAI